MKGADCKHLHEFDRSPAAVAAIVPRAAQHPAADGLPHHLPLSLNLAHKPGLCLLLSPYLLQCEPLSVAGMPRQDDSTRVRAKPVVVKPAADVGKQEPADVREQADVAQQGAAAQDSSGKVTHDVLGGGFKHDPATNVTYHALDTAKAGSSLETGLGQKDNSQSTSAAAGRDSNGPMDVVTAGGGEAAAGVAGQQDGGAGSGGSAGTTAEVGDSGSGGASDDDSSAANNDKLAEEAAIDTEGYFDDDDYGDPYNSTTDVDPDQDELGGGDEEDDGDADGAAEINPDADPDSADEAAAEEGADSAGGGGEVQGDGDADLGGDIGDDDEDEAPVRGQDWD